MRSVGDGVFERPEQHRSFVQRMAARTKSKMLNFKSYKTISLLPKQFVRPDSGTWKRFGQENSDICQDSEHKSAEDVPPINVFEHGEADTSNASSRRLSCANTRKIFNSGIMSPFNYVKRKQTFEVTHELTAHFPESKITSGSSQQFYLGENENHSSHDGDSSPSSLPGVSSVSNFMHGDFRKDSDWKSCVVNMEDVPFSNGFWQEWRSQMNKMWVIFTGETTAHGYKRTMAAHRSKVGRCLWIMATLGVTVIVMVLLYNMILQQDLYSFSSSIKSQPHVKMVFPAVTICNLAPYDFSLIDETLLKNYSVIVRQFLLEVAALQSFAIIPNDTRTLNLFKQFDTKDLHELIGWRLDKFIKRCYWNEVLVSCSEIFVRSLTITQSCFTFNFDPDKLKYADRVGTFSGLGVLIDVGSDVIDNRVPTGLKVLLHEPMEFPNSREDGMLVSPGTTTYISVAKNEYKFLPRPYKAYGTEHCSDTTSQDDDEVEETMVQYYNYTGYSSCVAECRLRVVLEKCGCVVYARDPDIPGVPYCTMDTYITCYLPTLRETFMQSPYQIEKCTCALPCQKVEYLSQMSSAAFQRTVEGVIYLDQNTFDPDNSLSHIIQNYVELKIFYKELFTHIEEHMPMYTWLTIFGNVGGQMGLFTGASVLTILEFLELSMLIVWFLVHTGYRYFKVRRKPIPGNLNGTREQENIKP